MSVVATARSRQLWLGVFVAPAAWIAAGLLGYVLVARSCERGRNGLGAYGVRQPGLVLAILAAVMLAVSAYGLAAALGSRRALRDAGVEGESTHRTAAGTSRFLAVAGIFTSLLMLGGIALFGIPTFLLQVCSQAH